MAMKLILVLTAWLSYAYVCFSYFYLDVVVDGGGVVMLGCFIPCLLSCKMQTLSHCQQQRNRSNSSNSKGSSYGKSSNNSNSNNRRSNTNAITTGIADRQSCAIYQNLLHCGELF